MNGYRKMISDNIPKWWDIGLRWCKARSRWIEYVYENEVKPYNNDYRSKKERDRLKSLQCRRIVGKVKLEGIQRTFSDSLQFDRMDDDEKIYWKSILLWVKWFQKVSWSIESYVKNIDKSTPINTVIINMDKELKFNNIKLSKFILNSINYEQ